MGSCVAFFLSVRTCAFRFCSHDSGLLLKHYLQLDFYFGVIHCTFLCRWCGERSVCAWSEEDVGGTYSISYFKFNGSESLSFWSCRNRSYNLKLWYNLQKLCIQSWLLASINWLFHIQHSRHLPRQCDSSLNWNVASLLIYVQLF